MLPDLLAIFIYTWVEKNSMNYIELCVNAHRILLCMLI